MRPILFPRTQPSKLTPPTASMSSLPSTSPPFAEAAPLDIQGNDDASSACRTSPTAYPTVCWSLLCCGSGGDPLLSRKMHRNTETSPLDFPSRRELVKWLTRPHVDILGLKEEGDMQEGSVVREHRKLGPDVWCYRWWEARPNGNRVHRRIVLGTAHQLRDISSARLKTTGLVREINSPDIRMTGLSMTLAQLADHFHQRELGHSNERISYSTKRAYQGYLDKWIVPRWGGYLLPNNQGCRGGAVAQTSAASGGNLLQNPEHNECPFQPCPSPRSLRPQPDSMGEAECKTP